MMNPKNVLIFPAGTEIALEIWNALKYSKFVKLFGANSMPSHAEFVFENHVDTLPFEGEQHFIDSLNELIDRWKIDYIYPAHDSACLSLTKARSKIHAEVVTSPVLTVEVCRSKNKTYDFFRNESFIPLRYKTADEIEEYPVFIKPAVGQGSVGAKIIQNEAELKSSLADNVEYSICEYLPGNEYTVDCFSDRNRVLRACHMRQREKIKMGIAVRSSLVPLDGAVRKIAEKINAELEFSGAWFFQLKKNKNDDYRLMEISPRIPGTMGVSRNLGINYPLLTLFNMWGYEIDIIDNEAQITLDRAFISRYKTSVEYDHVYLDFDDTVYAGDKVNVNMIAFIYQCVNKGVKISLLTKHSRDLSDTLKKYRLSELIFDEIIHLDKTKDKADYIKANKSIFIDDSFAERMNVRKKIGIPVYDLDMIESLIDWRM